MRLFRFFLVLFILSPVFNVVAQKKPQVRQPRILILLDASSSMLENWAQGQNRFQAAGGLVLKLMDSIYKVNPQVEFALRVYGNKHFVNENDCYDTRREVMFSHDNLTQMSLRLDDIQPRGVSPIAYSLKEAAENDLVDNDHYAYSLILITDGGESCGGNICEVVQSLLRKKIEFKPYIVSMIDYEPLKVQYECLGTYLKVSRQEEIPSTVGTIVEAYRQMITMPITSRKEFQTAIVNAPSVLKVDIPTFKISDEPKEEKPLPEKKQEPKPVPVLPPPLPKTTVAGLQTRSLPYFSQQYRIRLFSRVTAPDVIFSKPDEEPVAVNTPPPAAPVTAPPPPVMPPVKKTVTIVKKNPEKPKDGTYTVQREEAKETTLEVFFTNGKNKFYKTTPKILLLDPNTGKQVKNFYRTIDASGNPDPQQLPVGQYDLTVEGKSNFVWRNVKVEQNKNNKVYVVVNRGSLRFEYLGNPDRPVSEFVARVNNRFEPGPVINQECTKELMYEPADYHIVVNTLPPTTLYVPLEFDVVTTLRINEPGYAHITNTNTIGKVQLKYPLGDQFVNFFVLNVTGNTENQKLRLQPGVYEAYYNINGQDKKERFNVRSNAITEIQLR